MYVSLVKDLLWERGVEATRPINECDRPAYKFKHSEHWRGRYDEILLTAVHKMTLQAMLDPCGRVHLSVDGIHNLQS